MPLTPDQVLADRISRLKASLVDSSLADKRIIFQELAIAQQAANSAASTGGGGVSDVTVGIDSSADINSILFLLSQLVDETVNSKSIATVLLQDESLPSPRYFAVQSLVDNTTGAVTPVVVNPDCSPVTVPPTGELSPVRSGADWKVQENRYAARNAGTGFAAGHSIVNIRLIDNAGAIKATTWYNISTGLVVSGIPNILADLAGYEDLIEELIRAIILQLPVSLGAKTRAQSLSVALATDTELPLPQGAATEQHQLEEILELESIGIKLDLNATEATQLIVEDRLNEISEKLPASLGDKPKSESLSAVLATDATLPLPIGAATDSQLIDLTETLGILTDISIPADETLEATAKGLLRLMNKRIATASTEELAALGDALETDVVGNPGDFGSIKAAIRGAWADQRNILGDTTDVSTGGINDPGTLKMLLRVIGSLLINGEQVTAVYDSGTGQRASVTAPTVRATDEPALVVAISPHTPVAIDILPGTIEADIAAIRANTARISQYQFQLAQTTAGLVFLVRTDSVTGVSVNIDVATGAVIAPGSIELTDPIMIAGGGGSSLQLLVNEFEAITVSAGDWAVGDILTRVLVVDTATGTVSTTIWQRTDGTAIATGPLLGTDVIDADKQQIQELRQLRISTGSIGDPVATTDTGNWNLISLLKRLNSKFLQGAQVTAAGLGIALPKKTYIVGHVIGVGVFANLLDAPGLGVNPTDVSSFSSCELELRAVGGTLSYTVQTCYEPTFTLGVVSAESIVISGVGAASGSITSGGFVKLSIDLTRTNYLRVNATAAVGTTASRVNGTFSQIPGLLRQPVIVTNSVNINGSITATHNGVAIGTDLNGTITTSTTSGSLGAGQGLSRTHILNVTAISPTTTLLIEIQEPIGASWQTVYKFAPITTVSGQVSVSLPNSGSNYRYVETLSGTALSVTRTMSRTQCNIPSTAIVVAKRSGGFGVSDLPVYGKARRIVANNRSGATLFLQVHNKATALAAGDVPNSEVYPVINNGVFVLSAADLSESGTMLGLNSRLGLSSTFATYTPVAATPDTSVFVESV